MHAPGPAGAGKTQLCKQLTVCAQLPVLHGGMGGGVIYIDTEAKFSAARLDEIARARWPDRFATDAALEALTRGVVVFTPTTSAELLARLDGLEKLIIERGAKLVVVDSIAGASRAACACWNDRMELLLTCMCVSSAFVHLHTPPLALMRSEYGREQLAERQTALGQQASRLKQLAEAFRIPIVVTNQVTAVRLSGVGGGAFEHYSNPDAGATGSDAHIAAALGTKWAHDVNTRLALEVTADGERLITVRVSVSRTCAHCQPFIR
jgi:RAD51-like protein 1